MSRLPSLQDVVDAVLEGTDGMPSTGITVTATAVDLGTHGGGPPDVLRHAVLDLAHGGSGGRLLVDIPDGRYRRASGRGRVLVDRSITWAAEIDSDLIEDSLVVAYDGGEIAVLQIAAKARGTLPGRGERDAVEEAEDDDLDSGAVRAVLRCARVPTPPSGWWGDDERAEAAMLALGIAVGSPFAHQITLAGLIAFGRQPWRRVAGARLIVRSGRVWEERGSLGQILARLSSSVPLPSGLRPSVVRELVLNAFAHRDWSPPARDAAVILESHEDRIEVVNPGSLGDLERPPNPLLYDLLRRRGVTTGLGGLSEVKRELSASRGQLLLNEAAQEVRAVARVERPRARQPIAAESSPARPRTHITSAPRPVPPPAAAPAPPTVRAAISPAAQPLAPAAESRDDVLCALLRSGGRLNARQIEQALGWSRSSTRDTLARLIESGRVRRLAASPRSPDQAYEAS